MYGFTEKNYKRGTDATHNFMKPRKRTRKRIKADRLWTHWLYWLSPTPFGPDLLPISSYNPELYRSAFDHFQTRGRNGLTDDELRGIHPLIDAQKSKEITLTSLAEESMEWWANGWGWVYPWDHTINTRTEGNKPMDRLTLVAILRTVKSIEEDPHGFFERHPGISDDQKHRHFGRRYNSLSQEIKSISL